MGTRGPLVATAVSFALAASAAFTQTEVTPGASAVTASTNDGNVPGNVVDNNLGTRWSGNGDGAWIQLDLGTIQSVGSVRVAVHSGNSRQNHFELQVSSGGGTWDTVWSGSSSGTTTLEETYDFLDVDARWVRYLGHGSTATTFNSVSEISVFAGSGVPPTPTPTPMAVTPTPTSPVPTATPTATPPATAVEITPGGSAVTASTNDGNLPANTVDNNLATRWSGNGDGAWIQYDLGATRTVQSVNIGWYQGNTRVSTFDVLASDSPTGPWTTLAAGRQSAGNTTAIEAYDVTDGSGRYLRILGHGNNLNGWNSLTEVQIWGVP
jgi:endoglucanase